MRSPSRRLSVLAGLVASAALAGTTRAVWAEAIGPDLTGTYQSVAVTGGSAAPAVLALAIVALAASLATALSSRWLRYVTGPVLIIAGIGAGVSALGASRDPVQASGSAIIEATGVAGADIQADATIWPLLALLPAAALIVMGGIVLLAGGTWSTGNRYRSAATTVGGSRRPDDDPAAAWDALTRGEDPTADDSDTSDAPEDDTPTEN